MTEKNSDEPVGQKTGSTYGMSTKKNGNKWQFRCPNDHVQWEVREDGYYCEQCEDHFDFLVESEPAPFHY